VGAGDSGRENPCKGPEVECALRKSQKARVGRTVGSESLRARGERKQVRGSGRSWGPSVGEASTAFSCQ